MKSRMIILVGIISLLFSCAGETETTTKPSITKTEKTTPPPPKENSAANSEVAHLKKPSPKPRSEEELKAAADAKTKSAKANKEAEEEAVAEAEKATKKEAKEIESKKKTVAKKKKSTPKASSLINFEKTTHNFGTAKEGELISHKFFFENKGKTDLLIKDATATCGCTVPSYPKVPVRPGESSYIRVSFNTKAKTGNQAPVVTIYTNARKTPYKLKLEGVVEKAEEKEAEETSSEG